MGHVQTSRLIPAPRCAVFRHITELRNLPEWLSPTASRTGSAAGVETADNKRWPETFVGLRAELPGTPPRLRERSEFTVDLIRLGVTSRSHFCVDEFVVDERFRYRQLNGFFRSWSHTQTLIAHDAKMTLLTDSVTFRLKYGVLGALFDDLFVRRDVEIHLEHRSSLIEAHFRRDWTDDRREFK